MNYITTTKHEIKELMPYNAFLDIELRSIKKSGIEISFLLDRMEISPYGKRDRKPMRD